MVGLRDACVTQECQHATDIVGRHRRSSYFDVFFSNVMSTGVSGVQTLSTENARQQIMPYFS